MTTLQNLAQKGTLSLFEAARLLSETLESEHDMEVVLAEAIERGELTADTKRWATEQWQGKQLPGNINWLETYISRRDLDAWLARKGKAIPA